MELFENKIDGDLIYDGKIMRVERDRVMLENGSEAIREVVRHNGGACIVAVTDDNRVLLVRQFRYPYGKVISEIPAGKLEKGESPYECAVRELREETGAEGDVEFLAEFYPTPGYSNEIIYIYLARNLKVGQNHLDNDEFIKVDTVEFDKAIDAIHRGEILDGKTIIGLLLAKEKIGL